MCPPPQSGAILRHERMAVAVALAESQHHSAQRPKMARAKEEVRVELHGHDPERPPPSRSSSMSLPRSPAVPGHLVWVSRGGHRWWCSGTTMEHKADICPFVQILDAPVPQLVDDQLMDAFRSLDSPMAEQVITVPKISYPSHAGRTALREPQRAEQLVEVPTIVSLIEVIRQRRWSWQWRSSRSSPQTSCSDCRADR